MNTPPKQKQQQQASLVNAPTGGSNSDATTSTSATLHTPFFTGGTPMATKKLLPISLNEKTIAITPLSTNAQPRTLPANVLGAAATEQHYAVSPASSMSAVGFSRQRHVNTVKCAITNQPLEVHLQPRVEGGFFVHNNVWTCYRRNFFRLLTAVQICSAQIQIAHDEVPPAMKLVTGMGDEKLITGFLVKIEGRTNMEPEKMAQLVCFPSFNSKDGQVPALKRVLPSGVELEPAPRKAYSRRSSAYSDSSDVMGEAAHLHLMHNAAEISENSRWAVYERTQFQSATSNNGKRRVMQELFSIDVKLLAKCEDGLMYEVSTAQSDDIVVRGRSPSHYAESLKKQRHHEMQQQQKLQEQQQHQPHSISASSSIMNRRPSSHPYHQRSAGGAKRAASTDTQRRTSAGSATSLSAPSITPTSTIANVHNDWATGFYMLNYSMAMSEQAGEPEFEVPEVLIENLAQTRENDDESALVVGTGTDDADFLLSSSPIRSGEFANIIEEFGDMDFLNN